MNSSTSGYLDPYKMAKNKHALEGRVAIADMPRVSKMLDAELGEVEYKLLFGTDIDQRCFVSGKLNATVQLRCQRCLRPFSSELSGDFLVSPVTKESEAKLLPDAYEPILLKDGKLYSAELIEDELILALPIVPMHTENCVEGLELVEQSTANESQGLDNPFKVLQTLSVKKKGQQEDN